MKTNISVTLFLVSEWLNSAESALNLGDPDAAKDNIRQAKELLDKILAPLFDQPTEQDKQHG